MQKLDLKWLFFGDLLEINGKESAWSLRLLKKKRVIRRANQKF
jgi:hypothetical protein